MPHPRLHNSTKAQIADYVRTADGSLYVRIGNTVIESTPEKHSPHYVRFSDASSAQQFLLRVIKEPISEPIHQAIFFGR